MFTERLNGIMDKIDRAARKKGRTKDDILLLTVTKTVDSDMVDRAYKAGLRDFGENRVADLNRKQLKQPEARWHMIGHLQTNKVKELITTEFHPYLIHSLDSWRLAEELNKRGQGVGQTINTLLQVNVAKEPQKAGLDVVEVQSFLESIYELKYISLLGLMTMAPVVEKAEEVRPVFQELFLLRKQLQNKILPGVSLNYLSMGMSQDYEIAIEEGSDMIRIGSALFH